MVEKVEIGNATLYLGDCREIMLTLADFGAVVTDPPYGIADRWKGGGRHGWGKAKADAETRNEWDGAAPSAETLDHLRAMARATIFWGGNYFPLPPSRCWLIWNKPERGFTLAEAELAWTSFDNVVRVFDYPRSEPDRVHPTQKPVALMRWCVAKTAGSVFDPFMGSGTTGVACHQLKRPFVGIEAHRPYFEIACRRIEEAQRQDDLFLTPAEAKDNSAKSYDLALGEMRRKAGAKQP
jgi:site-specific DNA-methyltransferase (adenine-specific)